MIFSKLKEQKLSKKKIILLILAIVIVVVAVVGVILSHNRNTESEEITYKVVKAEHVTMKQTITAAGQVTAGDTETIKLAKNKTFKAVNVDEKELVKKGQPLVYYKDGSHTDAVCDGIVKSISVPKTGDKTDDSYKIQLSKLDKAYLKVTIPEDTINYVSKNDKAKIVVNSQPNKEFRGTIIGIKAMSTNLMKDAKGQVEVTDEKDEESDEDSDEDAESDTEEVVEDSEEVYEDDSDSEAEEGQGNMSYYAVTIQFNNDSKLRPGMSANTTITISDRQNVLAIPVEAVKFDDDGKAYVLVGDKSKPEKKSVKTGESDPMNVEILSGLSKGDEVLVETTK